MMRKGAIAADRFFCAQWYATQIDEMSTDRPFAPSDLQRSVENKRASTQIALLCPQNHAQKLSILRL